MMRSNNSGFMGGHMVSASLLTRWNKNFLTIAAINIFEYHIWKISLTTIALSWYFFRFTNSVTYFATSFSFNNPAVWCVAVQAIYQSDKKVHLTTNCPTVPETPFYIPILWAGTAPIVFSSGILEFRYLSWSAQAGYNWTPSTGNPHSDFLLPGLLAIEAESFYKKIVGKILLNIEERNFSKSDNGILSIAAQSSFYGKLRTI